MLQHIGQRFNVTIRPVADATNSYDVTFHVAHDKNGRVKGNSLHKARVARHGPEMEVAWSKRPATANGVSNEFEEDLRRRMRLMFEWLDLVGDLIETVRAWANESDWSTRIVDKPMEDAEIGTYRAPALLLQHETTKALLEPIARPMPESEGVVDFYVMPGFDDIASFHYADKQWSLQYQTGDRPLRQGKARPLTKANFLKVLEEMRRHAQRGL